MEIEFKFQVPPAQVERIENALRAGTVQQVELQARYYDTADRALAAAGIALRLRSENGQWVQTLKARGEGVLERFEHNVTLVGAPSPDALPDVHLHDGTPVGRLLGKTLGQATLVPTFVTDMLRLVAYEDEGASKAELALDIGEVRTVDASGVTLLASPVCELEIELVQGDAADLVPIARRWIDRHDLFVSTLSKSERGNRLLAPDQKVAPVKSQPLLYPKRTSRLDGSAIQRRVIAACLAQVMPNASEVAAGNTDPDVVHQLRVGLRRLRTALRELDGLDATGFPVGWAAPLAKVFAELGRSRDHELLVNTVQPALEAAGGPALQLRARTARAADVGAAVRVAEFQIVLCELVGFSMAGTKGGVGDPRKVLRKRLRALHRKVVDDAQAFASLPADAQHRVRKRLKRLRYLAEFVGPLFDGKQADAYIEGLVPAQDELGRFNDMVVASASYRALAARSAKAWFAVGWFAALERSSAQDCRRALKRIDKLRKFWK